MIQHHPVQNASKEPLNPIWKRRIHSLVPFMHHDPRDLGNEKGTGAEMLPAIVCGIATGDAPRMSIETVPDVSGSFDSSQFPSRF